MKDTDVAAVVVISLPMSVLFAVLDSSDLLRYKEFHQKPAGVCPHRPEDGQGSRHGDELSHRPSRTTCWLDGDTL